MPREALLARTFVELADTLVADFDVVELLTLLTDRCVDLLDVGAAGIMLVASEGDLRVMASSSEVMRVLELFEVQSQQGPCLDCYVSGQPVVNHDLAVDDGRWPRFAAEALYAGFHSVHALPMRLRGAVIGALNLFHIEPGEMRPADVDAAQALADVATIAILQYNATHEGQLVNEQLDQALNTRVIIEQAKGMVAEREGLDMAQAFVRLRNHDLRLVDLARAVVDGTRVPLRSIPYLRPETPAPIWDGPHALPHRGRGGRSVLKRPVRRVAGYAHAAIRNHHHRPRPGRAQSGSAGYVRGGDGRQRRSTGSRLVLHREDEPCDAGGQAKPSQSPCSLAGASCRRENGAGTPATPTLPW